MTGPIVRAWVVALGPSPWRGEEGDDELLRLLMYLESLRSVENVRAVEKRGWRRSRNRFSTQKDTDSTEGNQRKTAEGEP